MIVEIMGTKFKVTQIQLEPLEEAGAESPVEFTPDPDLVQAVEEGQKADVVPLRPVESKDEQEPPKKKKRGRPPKKKKEKEEKETEESAEASETTEKSFEIDLRDTVMAVVGKLGYDAARELLSKFNASKLSEVAEADKPALLKEAKELLKGTEGII